MGKHILNIIIVFVLAVSTVGCRRGVPPATPDESGEGATGGGASGGESSDDSDRVDVEMIYQVVLNMPEMEQFWHTDDAPDRSPLIVLENEITPADLTLSAFGQPVQILPEDEIGDRPFFVFRSLERGGDRASVSFAYEEEGVIGTVDLERRQGLWIVVDQAVAEH